MIELFKTLIPLFTAPKDYQELLRKLASFSFWQIYALTWVFRAVPQIGEAVSRFEARVFPPALIEKLGLENLNPSGFAVALLVAFVFYFSEFHNQLAKIFKIRERFDTGSILLPLASLVGIALTETQQSELRVKRNSIMGAVFYNYASSAKNETLVDKHDIVQALTAWSWFWIAEEGVVIWLVALIASFFVGAFWPTAISAGIIAFWFFVGGITYPRLDGLARAQIEQIARNPTAKLAVQGEFNAL